MKWLLALLSTLSAVAVAQDKQVTVPILPGAPFMIVGDTKKDVLVATGSMVYPNGDKDPGMKPADALNVVRIECYPSSTKTCIEAVAAVQDNQLLTVTLDVWEITEITPTRLVAQSAGVCASNTLTINTATKQVSQVRENGGMGDYSKCVQPQKELNGKSLYVPMSHPVVWTLVDGMCVPHLDSRFSEWRVKQKENDDKWNKWFHENCK